jgi:hypothetical protein
VLDVSACVCGEGGGAVADRARGLVHARVRV